MSDVNTCINVVQPTLLAIIMSEVKHVLMWSNQLPGQHYV